MNTAKKIMLCVLLVLASVPAYGAEYVPGDVLVVLKPSESEGRLTAASLGAMGRESLRAASFAASSGAWVKELYPAISEAGSSVYALMHSENKSPEVFAQELMQNPEVLAASPNYIFHAAVIPNDSYITECWGMNYINAPSAWNITTGSSAVYVAVLDSGIDYENPDLTGNIASAYEKNTIGGDSAQDDYGHGTHVAGIIGAVGDNHLGVAGVNWDVRLIPVKTLDKTGDGTFSQVINALNYVTELIQQGVNIKAVNMSVEAYLPTVPTHDNLVKMPLWRAFKALDELNKAVIVVAAGNQGIEVGQPTTQTKRQNGAIVYEKGYYVYPPSFEGLDNMISVSALDIDGDLADFTNTNADISAPGVNISSTWLQSASRFVQDDGTSIAVLQGTSMAAPFVSGAAALLASVSPSSSAYQLKRAILDGSGSKLNVYAALDYLDSSSSYVPYSSYDNTDYNDYYKYEETEDTYTGKTSGGGGGGGCNGYVLNVFAGVMILALIFIKRPDHS